MRSQGTFHRHKPYNQTTILVRNLIIRNLTLAVEKHPELVVELGRNRKLRVYYTYKELEWRLFGGE